MDFELPEDIKMLQTTIRKVVREELLPLEKVAMDIDKETGSYADMPDDISDKLKKRAMELGIWYGNIPQEFGGGGLSNLADAVITEEQNYSLVMMPTTSGLGGPILLASDPSVRDKFLPKLLKGDIYSCFAQTEPAGGTDVAGIQTFAEKKGDEYILNGRKTFISGAQKSDIAFVVAVTDKAKGTHGGISTFVVDTHQPGWKIARRIPTMGSPFTAPCEVLLEDVKVSADNMIGAEGRGFANASRFLSHGRASMGAMYTAWSQRSTDMAVDYAKKRVTFGEPLSNRQAVQWMLVDNAISTHAGRLMLYHAAWWTDEHPEADNRFYTSMLRIFASENGLKSIDKAIQIHGGLGYSKDLPLEMFYRRARLFSIGEGPNEIQRFIVARSLFKG
jgi:acyl-CoA dehydrogenase